MKRRLRPVVATLVLLAVGLAPALPRTGAAPATAQEIPTPESFFGHRMGAEGRLAHWDQLVEYYRLLGERSPRLRVWEMGTSTLGAPFLALFVSSPDNLARLDELRRLNATLADPRGHSEAEIERAIEEGRAVVVRRTPSTPPRWRRARPRPNSCTSWRRETTRGCSASWTRRWGS